MLELPLYEDRHYNYTKLLNDVYWTLEFLWNPRNQQWSLSISYEESGEAIISNVPLLPGVDILEQFEIPSSVFGKLILWNDSWNDYINAGKKPDGGFQDMGFSAVSDTAENPDSGTWQLNLNPVTDYTLYYFTPDETISDSLDCSFTLEETEGDAILTKTVYPGWEPS